MVTAQSFNPVNLDGTPVSDAQMQTLEQAIRYLSQDAEAAVLLKQAADSGVTIKLSREMGGFYDPNTHHIEWNPEFSGGVQDDMDTGYISPAMVLLHEIVHSIDKQRYVEYIELGGSCTVHAEVCHITSNQFLLDMRNSHEKLAVETEQRIARRLGEPIRTTYSDTIGSKTVSSPLHSSREYIRDGKFYQENSQGHTQEADGSVYTKEKTVTYNGQIETRQIDKFDDVF